MCCVEVGMWFMIWHPCDLWILHRSFEEVSKPVSMLPTVPHLLRCIPENISKNTNLCKVRYENVGNSTKCQTVPKTIISWSCHFSGCTANSYFYFKINISKAEWLWVTMRPTQYCVQRGIFRHLEIFQAINFLLHDYQQLRYSAEKPHLLEQTCHNFWILLAVSLQLLNPSQLNFRHL